ncbi:MAG: LLM class F420-dependent oxidoreductase [Dehalococcoidia bacterium]
MKIGFHLPQVGPLATRDNLRAAAQAVEEAGFDSVWVSEHIVIPRKQVTPYSGAPSGKFPIPPDMPFLDSLATLTFVAACTERVQLGTSVCILPWRNPVITAKELVTLDVLSNGRLIFGVGAGWWVEEFEMLGVPFEHRGSRLDEYIRLLKALWTEENPRFRGRFWQIEEVGFSPKPVQKPHPPIWMGGDSDVAFRRVGRLADAWHASHNQPEELPDKYARIQTYAREAGRDPQSVGLTARASVPTEPPQAIERLKAYAQAGVNHLALEIWVGSLDQFRAIVKRFASEVRPALAT